MKVNLSDVRARIVGRGRKAYANETLANELATLGADEGFVWDEAQTPAGLDAEDRTNHRAKYRGRAESVAESIGLSISVGWLDDGGMLITHKKATKKQKAKK
jgi:hypothetical protein